MEQAAHAHLMAGERIVWEGRPKRGLLLRPIDALLIPFSLFWTGSVLAFNVATWKQTVDPTMTLFGIPFLVVGLYAVIGRFWIDARIRRRLRYVLTDARVLILKRNGQALAQAFDLARLPLLSFDQRRDGSGTIRFGLEDSLFAGRGFGIWQPTLGSSPALFAVPDVARVFERVQHVAQAAVRRLHGTA